MKKLLYLLVILTLTSSIASAQGVSHTNIALYNSNGNARIIASAVITVCAANNVSIPCSSPLSNTLFKDYLLSVPISNPFNADANGNFAFMAAPGNYTVTMTGVGITGYSYQLSLVGASTNIINGWTAEQDFINTGTNYNWRAWNSANAAYKVGLSVNTVGTVAQFSDTNGTAFGFKCCAGTFFAQDATGLSLLNLTNGQAILSAGTGILTNQFSLNSNGGATLTGGTALTADTNPFNLTWGYNNGAVTFNGVVWSITDAASGASSKIFQLNGGAGGATSLFTVSKAGNLAFPGNLTFGGGTAVNFYKTATDTPGAITVNAGTCTDRGVGIAGSSTGAVISVAANYALDANIVIGPAQTVAGTAHYRICNVTGANITLNAAATFNLAVIQ